jgi:hypothetical protein
MCLNNGTAISRKSVNERPCLIFPGLFSFGQQSSQTQGSGFNFSAGSSASSGGSGGVTSEQKNIFSFGASSSSGQVGNGFGSPSSFSATTPSFSFNATPKPEATSVNTGFGQPTAAPIFNPTPAAQPLAPPPAYPATGNTTLGSATHFNFGKFTFGDVSNVSSLTRQLLYPRILISTVAFQLEAAIKSL